MKNITHLALWFRSPMGPFGLVFLLFTFALFNFVASREGSALNTKSYLALLCGVSALLCFPGSPILIAFFCGEAVGIGIELQRQGELILVTALLVSHSFFINQAYGLRIRKTLLVSQIILAAFLILGVWVLPLLWIQSTILALGTPSIFLLLYLFLGSTKGHESSGEPGRPRRSSF